MKLDMWNEFRKPGREYTPFPFWFWNDELDKQSIENSLIDFNEKGVHGVIIHPRIGLPKSIGYLSEEFFDLVSFAVEKAKDLEMKVILYDEGMYPSGSAHGKIVENHPELASKGCFLKKNQELIDPDQKQIAVLGEYTIQTDQQGSRNILPYQPGDAPDSHFVLIYAYSGGNIRGVHLGEDDHGNPPQSADLLQLKTAEKFLEYTHDQYYVRLAPHFGSTIIAFFTDEPDILGRNAVPGMIPWGDDFERELKQLGLEKVDLPRLFLEPQKDRDRECRKLYEDLVWKRLTENYYLPLSNWCKDHHIALTGHPHNSMDIGILEYFDIPGQDMVWRWVGPGDRGGIVGKDSPAAKCSVDAARHLGRARNANEIFGCCGTSGAQWDFTLRDMKWYLDWLFVRGVNFIYPHAFFSSIQGARIEDRPPDVGPHNMWWPYYSTIADYSKRMSWLLTGTHNRTNIGVICRKDHLPWKEVVGLYENQLEFNYVEEKYLNAKRVDEEGYLVIQKQRYNILLLAEGYTKNEKIREIEEKGVRIFSLDPSGKDILSFKEWEDQAENRPVLCSSVPNLRYSCIEKEDRTFHLFSNEGESICHFEWKMEEESLLELNPLEGRIWTVSANDKGNYTIELYPRELKIYTEKRNGEDFSEKPRNVYEEVAFSYQIQTSRFDLDDFNDWTEKERFFSGEVLYEIELQLENKENAEKYFLDLGNVHDIVVRMENKETEKKAPILFTPPYLIPIENMNQEGKSTVLIKVMNSLTNRYDQNPRKSGILGPVRLLKQQTER